MTTIHTMRADIRMKGQFCQDESISLGGGGGGGGGGGDGYVVVVEG
jgi:hypothetical protein